MKEHILKIAPEYFEAVASGKKTFEIRLNDRGFEQNDLVILREYIKERDEYTGDVLARRIGFITDFAQMNGYVVFSLLGD